MRADNDLLSACERAHMKTAVLCALSGISIGILWFVCVAIRAEALWSR